MHNSHCFSLPVYIDITQLWTSFGWDRVHFLHSSSYGSIF